MQVYFDNAATTPLAPEVLDAMMPYMREFHGNPSSTHAQGRVIRSAIEEARKNIAGLLNVKPSNLFFTSGGTESDNLFLRSTVKNKGITHLITSKLEHHAVLNTALDLGKDPQLKVSFVNFDERGIIDLEHLEELLKEGGKALVSLMHGNNEVGNMLPMNEVSSICKRYEAIFHSDAVQTLGHFPLNLQELGVDSIAGAAHKFHGPKGVGLLYVKDVSTIEPILTGGGQERGMRSGTENVYGIVGLEKALSVASDKMEEEKVHLLRLKTSMMEQLQQGISSVCFNGLSGDINKSLYAVLSVALPPSPNNDMLLFQLDLQGISASGGSACSSGAAAGSHVIEALAPQRANWGIIRFSFSRYNTIEEVTYVAEQVKKLYHK